MNSRTPGFSGQRLREAREVRGVQQASLADKLGLSAQAISKYERGAGTPSPDVLGKLAEQLNVSRAFFLLPERPSTERRVFYRSMAAATKGARVRAEHRARWLGDLTSYVSPFVQLPPVNIPDFDIPDDPLQLENADIEQVAADTRAYWGMRDDPIGNMVTLLENQGVIIARDQLGAATLDSLSEYDRAIDRPLVIIGTDKGTPARWRFDAAHELGHLILHRHVDRKWLKNPAEHKALETQAHRFAGAFLLPRVPFCEELFAASLDAMLAIKARWRVSIAMMIMRARQTRLIGEETEKRLWINYSRRGWRRAEPLDESMPTETPRLLHRSLELIFEAGVQSSQDVMTVTGLPQADIEALAGLPDWFMERGIPPVALRLDTEWPENVTPLRKRG